MRGLRSPAVPGGKRPEELLRRMKEVNRRRKSSKFQVRARQETLRRMSAEAAEQRAQLVQMREELAGAEASAEEMAEEVARMRGQNQAIMLLHCLIHGLAAEE